VAAEEPPDAADRTAALLALVLERAPRTLAELAAATAVAGAAELDAPLAALERHGLVGWDSARTELRPGPAALRFARSGQGSTDVVARAETSMRRLAEESGESVMLMVPTPGGAQTIAQEDGRHLLGAVSWIGRSIPDHASAAGKVFLAHGVADAPEPLERLTARTIVDDATLERELAIVRDRGYATLVDELEPGLSAVAAPVFDAGGGVVAALTVSGPTARLDAHRLALLGGVAIEQAHAVSVRLGFAGALEDALGGALRPGADRLA
jgi:IclR family transcriptional regulator, acetate operon repressor